MQQDKTGHLISVSRETSYRMQGKYNYNSNSTFIVLNLHLKTDSRCTKQKKQRTIIINQRHKEGSYIETKVRMPWCRHNI